MTWSDVRLSSDEYADWLADVHNVPFDDRYRSHFIDVVGRARTEIQKSGFWQALQTELPEIDARFQIARASVLIPAQSQNPTLKVKPVDSFLGKTYRLNVLRNDNWPAAPDGGWYLPPDWFSRVKDLVRTTILVRYLDGVREVLAAIEDLCDRHSLALSSDLEARSEGYYAAHAVLDIECEVPSTGWETERRVIKFEIQIATVVQDVVKELLHRHYAQRRMQPVDFEEQWQWMYESDEFATNYLAHISHYVDGMIVGLRDRDRKDPG